MGSGHAHPAPLTASCAGRIDARAKLLAVVPVIVALNALPERTWPASAAVGAGFLALIFVCGHGAGMVLRRVVVLLPFLLFFVLTLPFATPGAEAFSVGIWPLRLTATHEGLARAGQVTVRGMASILGVLFLSGTTDPPALFAGLRALGAPKAFAAVLSVIYRYIFQIGDEFSRVRRAAAARAFAVRDFRAVPRLASMAASLLVRSVERSERVHHAMLARGFDGEVRTLEHGHFGAAEWLFIAAAYCATTLAVMAVLNA